MNACSQHRGILDAQGVPVPTPQRLFVNDTVYANVNEKSHECIERTEAVGFEAIFILLGKSGILKCQVSGPSGSGQPRGHGGSPYK